jgi:hypothetical protein
MYLLGMDKNCITSNDSLKTIGERIEYIIDEMVSLYEATGVEYFNAHASGWSQWVQMLQDSRRREWQITYPGSIASEKPVVKL